MSFSSEPTSQFVVDLNSTEWVKIEVQSVSGTNITAVQTNHFKNGTENTETHTWNITDLFWRRFNVFIIEANLSEDDPINVVPYRSSPWPEPSLALTDTVSRRYAGAIREVNRMNDTFSKGKYAASDVDAYWDKMTGVLCELGETEFIGIPPLDWITNTTTRMKIIATNLWQPTPFWTEPLFWVIIGVIIVAVTASGILIWQRRKTLRAPNSSL